MFLHGQGRARIPAPLRSPRSAEVSSLRSPLIDRFPAVASRSTSRTSAERRQAERRARARRAIDSRRSQGCFVLDVLPRVYREVSRSVAVCWKRDSDRGPTLKRTRGAGVAVGSNGRVRYAWAVKIRG